MTVALFPVETLQPPHNRFAIVEWEKGNGNPTSPRGQEIRVNRLMFGPMFSPKQELNPRTGEDQPKSRSEVRDFRVG